MKGDCTRKSKVGIFQVSIPPLGPRSPFLYTPAKEEEEEGKWCSTEQPSL